MLCDFLKCTPHLSRGTAEHEKINTACPCAAIFSQIVRSTLAAGMRLGKVAIESPLVVISLINSVSLIHRLISGTICCCEARIEYVSIT